MTAFRGGFICAIEIGKCEKGALNFLIQLFSTLKIPR